MKIQDMIGIQPELRKALGGIPQALAGDIALRVSPATTNESAAEITAAIASAAGKYTRDVKVELVDSHGDVMSWYTGELSVAGSEVTAGSGTADTSAATVALVDGVGNCVLEYIGAWSAGVAQVETATVVGTITVTGDAAVVVTAAGMTGSPKTYAVPVVDGDDASAIATAIRAVLGADPALTALYDVGGTAAAITLTRNASPRVANDATLNVSIDNDTCAGITTAAASADTVAGVAADTATVTVTGGTIAGTVVSNKTSVDTLIA